VNDDQITARLGRLENLPTLPSVALKVLEAVRGEGASMDALAEILSKDPSLSAGILKVANSAMFCPPQAVITVGHAVKLLGTNTVRHLALGFSLIRNHGERKGSGLDYKAFWTRSLVGALACRTLAKTLASQLRDEAFTVGLLQDIGILALDQVMPEQYGLVLGERRGCLSSLQESEVQVLGVSHADVGAFLVRKWGLPDRISLPISVHHGPLPLNLQDPEAEPMTRLLHLSALFVEVFTSQEPARFLSELRQRIGQFGFEGRIDVQAVASEIQEEAEAIFPAFDCDVGGEKTYVEIVEGARNELMRISLDFEQRLLEQLRINESLRRLAMRDGLTNLLNYRAFRETLDAELHRSARYGNAFSLILGDIDHFKAINDIHGHLAGDAVLRAVADALRTSLRESDAVARYGGEEFAMVLPETSLEDALLVAERLRQCVERLNTHYDGKVLGVTMSFGVSTVSSGDPVGALDLIDRADRGMYRAKDEGRNRVAS
jgi:two-component system, cell cycle response regulator